MSRDGVHFSETTGTFGPLILALLLMARSEGVAGLRDDCWAGF